MNIPQRAQVVIIGAGPSGLLLGRLLDLAGIDNVILERRSPEYVLSRIRAGILEQITVDLLAKAQCDERLKAQGIPHHSVQLVHEGKPAKIDLPQYTGGRIVTAYGQTEVTKDLMDARFAGGGAAVYEAEDTRPQNFDTHDPYVEFRHGGAAHRIGCDIIVGCDGYHGPSRAAIPASAIKTYMKTYPFGWLGLLSDTPPVAREVVYINHDRGFALCSMRSHTRSRYYIQCDADDDVRRWSDEDFWTEFKKRLPVVYAETLVTGPSLEKSIAPLRSFVAEPMRFGRLLLAGDAAHVVPPTGAKGLNLAMSDIHYLHTAIIEYFADGCDSILTEYSRRALARVWKSEHFSWWLTNLTHRFNDDPFEQKMKQAEMEYLTTSEAGRRMVAENYVGLAV
ncbi:MAG: 4-hydroxybenzoate 3-monooxygenase [Hyphomonadaceae bacterium]|nr:4-hydroxybenzoate 3-monooxygenase [Hyphomonadaceae bacterium]